ncbi:DUF4134 family protein [Pedobacter panaciterrae]|uniref:DUF4134 family protein n=1 Tax=Pedobacter panaciterrae TaxID=363849 RepID=UPI00155DA052|nr:DUF4134 family protein [Pedobacter panaciterrae]NQX54462.1 DUF4134 family protein [Pedobacter panaciterrae]
MLKTILIFLIIPLCLAIIPASAQPGISEMKQATADLRQSFFSARDASLVLAALFGIAGAVNVYYNWQMGKDKITAKVAAWFFAAFFMILIGPFLQVLFGI